MCFLVEQKNYSAVKSAARFTAPKGMIIVMKRVIALALCLVMVFAIAGCDKKAEDDVPTLVWYVHGDSQPDVAAVMEEVNKITVPAIGAKVDLKFIEQAAYNEKMQMMMAANTEFDICFTGYVNDYRNAVKRGGLLQLDDLLKDYPDLKKVIPDYMWESTRFEGGIYAIPNLQIITRQWNMYTFKDLADKYGLEDIEINNLADVEPYLEKIAKNEPKYYPIRANFGTTFYDSEFKEELIQSQVFAFIDDKGEIADIDYKGYKEINLIAARRLHDWFKKGYIRADAASVSDDTQDQNAGKYAVWIEKYKPGILDEMKLKYGKEVVTKQISDNILYHGAPDAMTGISKTSKNPEKALELLQLVNTDKKLYNLICFGIEGKHYTLDDDGRVVYIENAGYGPKACWKFGNQFNALLLPGQPEDVWEQTVKMNDESIKSPLIGFTFDTDPVRNEISQVSTIFSEYGVIAKGAEDPDKYYDEMLERLKGAGIDKIIKEVKDQYNTWKATK